MIKISIIVPVYNTEKYLRRCLDSLARQSLKDIEIICVNDCSTDRSENIIQEYVTQDPRIKYISLPSNMGAAVARNRGMEKASGEYLGFVDSDDYVDWSYYEKLYVAAADSGAEISKALMRIYSSDGSIQIVDNEAVKESKFNFLAFYTTAIYRKDFLLANNIAFPENTLWGEDLVFSNKAVLCTNAIAFAEDVFYNYCPSYSRMTGVRPLFLQTYLDALTMIVNELNKHAVDDQEYKIVYTCQLELAWQSFALTRTEDREECVNRIVSALIKLYTTCPDRKKILKKRDKAVWHAYLMSDDTMLATDVFLEEMIGECLPYPFELMSRQLNTYKKLFLSMNSKDNNIPNVGMLYAHYIGKCFAWCSQVELIKREEAALVCAETSVQIFANYIHQYQLVEKIVAEDKCYLIPFLVVGNVNAIVDIFLERMPIVQKRLATLRAGILLARIEEEKNGGAYLRTTNAARVGTCG